jgi:thiol-disulfide isomerase/thioredoxin
MAKAVLLLKQGHYQEAIEALKRLNAQQGNKSAQCYWHMAQAYWGLKDVKKTEESCDRVFQYAGEDVQLAVMAHVLKGVAAESAAFAGDRGKFQEAEKEFRAAYELDKGFPGRENILVNIGLTQLHAGEMEKGLATLKDFLNQVPQGELSDRVRKVIANPRRAIPNAAPDFSLKALDGKTYTLAKLHGRIVLLDFWATWCTSCRESVPALARLAKKFSGAPFLIISVSGDDSAKAWQNYVGQHAMHWPQYHDTDGHMARLFGIQYLPTYILIDPDGILLLRQVGWAPELETLFQEQIAKRLKYMDAETAQSPQM